MIEQCRMAAEAGVRDGTHATKNEFAYTGSARMIS